MLVIYVISAVVVFITYTGVKLKLEEWFEETKMSRLRLKRDNSTYERSQVERLCPESPNNIEISSDESDIVLTNEIIESEKDSSDPSIIDTSYDEETLSKFEKSTDSIKSDEDIKELTYNTSSKSKTSMFNWNQQGPSPKKRNMHDHNDSDSSDDFNSKPTWFKKKHNEKKHKGSHIKQTKIKNEPDDKQKEETVAQVNIQHEQMISGIKVKLPVKPYSCQVAVMNQLIQGCIKQENCLLESPTGSGKTLALLCGVLAWHDHHVAEVQNQKLEKQIQEDISRDCKSTASHENNGEDLAESSNTKCTDYCEDYDEEEDFEDSYENSKKKKISKIFYGTRTHKQIEQVVRELRKTSYRHKKMTILSSREHTCIQETTKNKTELCNDLLDTQNHKGCPFYNESNKKIIATFRGAKSRGLDDIWDIEDLVTIGKNEGLCPYFAARSLMEQADIIFCPYNYIVDPDIRESMQLDVAGHVIILDEAHNIEDICREVASVSFREDHLTAVATECESLMKQRAADSEIYGTLQTYSLKLVNFLKTTVVDKVGYNSDNLSSPYWTGAELLELFNMNGLNEAMYTSFLGACNAAIADSNRAKEERRIFQKVLQPVISPTTKKLIEQLMFTIRMITSSEYMNDFRACITETTVKDFKYATENTWLSSKVCTQRVRTLKLLCMNPGVTFAPLARQARSIILASGTLSPTASFQSELGTSFAHVLNTGHVIPKEQVYAICIPQGPNEVKLRANYQSVNSWAFQDELGAVLLDVCESVPHGILCFFSSYNVMHTQMQRWINNSIWTKITSVKQIFIEPRHGGDLKDIMYEYRQVIEQTSDKQRGKITGALFLAVFRGKVAEGIDFKDNEARCVITVGIPYAVRKDPVIDMKLSYNDMNVKRGLLKGSEWYSIQAFRALNQALGRCLRHINDWGAVLLVDERFLMHENKENLPKWVKTMWVNQNGYNLRENLKDFVSKQKAREEKQLGITNS
ncbi:Fanconi anemia group J protein homolog isoform X1 [Bombus affinis]|uniref:Fanconi anemia group J protein homolog isoform X1 n=2 Tax=Bombus affinis TaxID=309941 RepID=UPI0021B75D99|nr:Fanconi anemia group J protein homolog isoform X1 [Bombus affinis]